MIIEQARVSRVEGERVWVECSTKSACEHCQAAKNCGTSAISKALPKRTQQIVARSSLVVKPGQLVEIGIPEDSLVRSALVVYLWPLFGLILGAVIGQQLLSGGDAVVIGGSLVGGGLGALLARRWSVRQTQGDSLQPQVLRVLSAESEVKITLVE